MKNNQSLSFIGKKCLVILILLTTMGLLGANVCAQDTNDLDAFITTWRFEPGASNSSLITLELNPAYEHNFVVDWGDGSEPETIVREIDPSLNPEFDLFPTIGHEYAEPNEYQVSITGALPSVSFAFGCENLVSINQWGTQKWKSMVYMFYACDNVVFDLVDPTEVPDLSEINPDGNGLAGMFLNSNFNGDISQWNVANVTDMSGLFADSNFNGDISQWNVANVADMGAMFAGSNFNGDISQWNVANVTDMASMFQTSTFNGNISQWNVANVTDMLQMFAESNFNGDISQWNVANVTDMLGMFADSNFNGDISQWNVANVAIMGAMFAGSNFNGDISQWNVANVADMVATFAGSNFNGDISQWNVANVTNMNSMFFISIFNGDISQWNVANVTDMGGMFSNSIFNGDISQWNVANVTDMTQMFHNARNFNGNLSAWDIRKAVSSTESGLGFFIRNTAISRRNYTTLLRGWANLEWENGTNIGTIDVGSVQFRSIFDEDDNDETRDARDILEKAGWKFIDGGDYDKHAERDNE